MKNRAKRLLALPLALLLSFAPAAFAQEPETPDAPEFSQAELDQMLAPIALYPDALLSQILMASTYPLEVVEAARWSRENPGLTGQQAVQAVEDRRWDPSVKSLVAFPQILATMDEKLEWMQQLGDAFLAQQAQVMDTVQSLRQKAYAAGNLKSNEHYRVQRQGEHIVVESPYREVIYVPYYDPFLVYGPWWWSAYPPVYWAPWPGYYPYAGFVGFRWSVGVFIGPRFFFGAWDWPHRHITVVHLHFRHIDHRHKAARQIWRHNPHHRHSVKYRHPAVQKKFAHWRKSPHARRDGRIWTRPALDHRGSRSGNASRGEMRRERDGHSNRGRDRDDDRGARTQPRRPDAGPDRNADNPRHERRAIERRHDLRERRLEARSIPKIGAQTRVNTPMVRLGPMPRDVPAATPRLHQEPRARSGDREERGRGKHFRSRREYSGAQAKSPAFRSAREARSHPGSPIRSSNGSHKFGEFRFR